MIFVRDEDPYEDKLLQCIVTVEEAKYFGAMKESKFYDPKRVPDPEENQHKNQMVNVIYPRFQQASMNVMKNLLKLNIKELEGMTEKDITNWLRKADSAVNVQKEK